MLRILDTNRVVESTYIYLYHKNYRSIYFTKLRSNYFQIHMFYSNYLTEGSAAVILKKPPLEPFMIQFIPFHKFLINFFNIRFKFILLSTANSS
jgi:hypothetical protein